jgi:hypothetical protein
MLRQIDHCMARRQCGSMPRGLFPSFDGNGGPLIGTLVDGGCISVPL